jgi:hypothetical protein
MMRPFRWYVVLFGKAIVHRSGSKKFAQLWADDFNTGLPGDLPKAIVIKEAHIATI